MNLLHSHIEQIAQSSNAIAELPFSTPSPFTNALLHTTDITTLIRDTEAHERALFTPLPSGPGSFGTSNTSTSSRGARKSIYPSGLHGDRSYLSHASAGWRSNPDGSRAHSAVARILGGDLMARIRRTDSGAVTGSSGATGKVDVDVDALLDGAERLCEVYPIDGAKARIAELRGRYRLLAASVARYEHIVDGQARELESAAHGRDAGKKDVVGRTPAAEPDEMAFTREHLKREEAEIKELEERRKLLEDRVYGMERDLGGLTTR